MPLSSGPDPLRPLPPVGGSQPANVLDPSRPSPGLLAPDPRVLWAAERTALAWIRTGVGLIAFGFVLARAPALLDGLGTATAEGKVLFPLCGLALIALGALAGIDGALRYGRTFRRLSRGEAAVHASATPLWVAAGVATIGAVIAAWVVWSLG